MFVDDPLTHAAPPGGPEGPASPRRHERTTAGAHEEAARAVLDATRILCPDRVIDRREGRVTLGGKTLSLSPTELRLLNYLADRPGRVVERDELWRAVWYQAPLMQSRAIDKTVRRLRTKIERDPSNARLLVTETGGYRLVP